MNIIAIIGIGLTAAIISIILKQYKPEMGLFIAMTAGILILTAAVSVISPVLENIQKITGMAGLDKSYGDVLLKALAICYITQLASDACRDTGESAIASKLELAGKIAVVLLALPLFEKIISVITTLMNG